MTKAATKKTILLVDDDIDFLIQTEAVLQKDGFQVIRAESQKEAEELLQNIKPDLAILDLMMENFDGGFALAYHVKKSNPGVPVIICSAVTSETGMQFDASTEEERSWIKADLFIPKPIRHEQLLREIHKLLKD
ncbi:MAG TPA: response regulator [Candidatus Marinimicrobia bacterium]|nr:response regulator [Candidatus Neomarinimicrobiota bacterium]